MVSNNFNTTHLSLFILSYILSCTANDAYLINNVTIQLLNNDGIGIHKNAIQNDIPYIVNGSDIQNWYLLMSGTFYKLVHLTDDFNSSLNSENYWWYQTLPTPNISAMFSTNITLIKPNVTRHSNSATISPTQHPIRDVTLFSSTIISDTDTVTVVVGNSTLNTDSPNQIDEKTLKNFFGNHYIYIFSGLCSLWLLCCIYLCVLIICRRIRREKDMDLDLPKPMENKVYRDASHIEEVDLKANSPDVIHIKHQSVESESQVDSVVPIKKRIRSQKRNNGKRISKSKSVPYVIAPVIVQPHHMHYNSSRDLLKLPQQNVSGVVGVPPPPNYPGYHYRRHHWGWYHNYNNYYNNQNVRANSLNISGYRHQHYCKGTCGFTCNAASNPQTHNNNNAQSIVSGNYNYGGNNNSVNKNVRAQRYYGNAQYNPNVARFSGV